MEKTSDRTQVSKRLNLAGFSGSCCHVTVTKPVGKVRGASRSEDRATQHVEVLVRNGSVKAAGLYTVGLCYCVPFISTDNPFLPTIQEQRRLTLIDRQTMSARYHQNLPGALMSLKPPGNPLLALPGALLLVDIATLLALSLRALI